MACRAVNAPFTSACPLATDCPTRASAPFVHLCAPVTRVETPRDRRPSSLVQFLAFSKRLHMTSLKNCRWYVLLSMRNDAQKPPLVPRLCLVSSISALFLPWYSSFTAAPSPSSELIRAEFDPWLLHGILLSHFLTRFLAVPT